MLVFVCFRKANLLSQPLLKLSNGAKNLLDKNLFDNRSTSSSVRNCSSPYTSSDRPEAGSNWNKQFFDWWKAILETTLGKMRLFCLPHPPTHTYPPILHFLGFVWATDTIYRQSRIFSSVTKKLFLLTSCKYWNVFHIMDPSMLLELFTIARHHTGSKG